jgi:transposase
VQDWAEVQRLHREGWSNIAIAEKLGMSRNTVTRLLALRQPHRYERSRAPSLLDPFIDQIAAMLDQNAKVAATVVLEHVRRDGFTGGITILKDHLAKVRPAFLAAKTFQRTSYLPGEVSQLDWWHTGAQIPVGEGATREAFALVTTLPHSAAHAAVFTLGRTIGDLLPAALGCFERLGEDDRLCACHGGSPHRRAKGARGDRRRLPGVHRVLGGAPAGLPSSGDAGSGARRG